MSTKRLAFAWLATLGLGLWLALAGPLFAVPASAADAAWLPGPALLSATSAITTTGSPTGSVSITAVDAEAFPDLTVYVAVNDGAGQHVAQLAPAAFTLTENSAVIPADKLAVSEKEVGIQAVFTLDTSAPFKTRDVNAVTRLDYIKQALAAFGTQGAPPRLADGIDDVTLLTPEGVLASHTSQGRDLATALATYTTTFSGAANPLPLVNQALDFASETMPRPGMPRYVVLFSNGLVAGGQAASLTDLVTRAQGAEVIIDTVYVGLGSTSDSVGAQSLQKLAQLTGGQFLVLEKPESITPLLSHLADQRLQYQLRYRSTLAITGQQSFSVQVRLPDGSQIGSAPATFPVRIEAPTVTLSSLPAVIHVSPSTSANEVISYSLPVAVDFPDGHPRHLRSVELLADGQVVDQQLAPPAGSLSLRWNLSGYKTSGDHALVAQAADELGLVAQSNPVTVTLSIAGSAAPASAPLPGANPPAVVAIRPRLTPLMLAGIGLLAVAVVVGLGGLWWLRRAARPQPEAQRPAVQPQPPAQPKAPAPNKTKTIPPPAKPAPPPPGTRPLTPRPPAFTFHAPALFPKRRAPIAGKPQGKAYLEVVEGAAAGAPRDPIEMLGPALRLGRDPARAEVVFQDRSVSRLHARIEEAPEGVFRVFDEGSTSGTWVNFTQIPAEVGWELKPGDLINLGRVQLRFKRRAQAAGTGGQAPGAPPGPGPSGEPSTGDGLTEPYLPVKK